MLQDMTAADDVSFYVGICGREKIRNKNNLLAVDVADAVAIIAWVEAETPIAAETAEQAQKITFAAANFNYSFVTQVIPLYQPAGKLECVFLKTRGKMERIFILPAVLHLFRVKCQIKHMAALPAESQMDVTCGRAKGLTVCRPEHIAMYRQT
jgi:hypothetical protein